MANRRGNDTDGGTRGTKKTSLNDRIQARQGVSSEIPDWGRIDGDTLRSLVEHATRDDGAVMLGYTRDGGAYSLKVYNGAEVLKLYAHSDAELYQTIQEVCVAIAEG